MAVKDVSFQIPHGSFVGIMGASGSGKTTLLNLIATIDKPTNGTIRISGQNIVDIPDEAAAEFRRRHLGFVFQEYNLLETSPFKIIAIFRIKRGLRNTRRFCI